MNVAIKNSVTIQINKRSHDLVDPFDKNFHVSYDQIVDVSVVEEIVESERIVFADDK